MDEKIKVVVLEPGKEAYMKEIDNTVEGMQEVVGGYYEMLPVKEGYMMVMCEDGRPLQMPPNFYLETGTLIVGTVFFARADGTDFVSMTTNEYTGTIKACKYLRRA